MTKKTAVHRYMSHPMVTGRELDCEGFSIDDFTGLQEAVGALNENRQLDPKTSKKDKFPILSRALHPEFSYPLVDVAELSIEKGYAPFNWLKKDSGVTVSSLLAAAQRHLDKVKLGIDRNAEEKQLDGTPTKIQPFHLAQVAYNCLMILLQQKEGVDSDNRMFYNGTLKVK